jgi:hypothetical protein
VSAELIETAAATRGPISADVVFLGGATIYLWVSDRAAPETRATDDIDVISAVVGKAGYYKLGERLRERGFNEASDSKVMCRWNHAETGLVLDVMPTDETVPGFSNRWYDHAIETALELTLPGEAKIRAASIVETHRNVHRHVCSVAQRLHTHELRLWHLRGDCLIPFRAGEFVAAGHEAARQIEDAIADGRDQRFLHGAEHCAVAAARFHVGVFDDVGDRRAGD